MDNIEDALTNLAGHLPFGGAPATEETTASNLSAAADIVSQDVVTSRNVFEAVSVTSTVSPPLTSTEAVDLVSTTRSLKTIVCLKKMWLIVMTFKSFMNLKQCWSEKIANSNS